MEVTAPAVIKAKRTYSVFAIGKSATRDGKPAAVTSIFTSDAMHFEKRSEYHSSPRHARQAFEEALSKATSIVERKALVDQNGREGEQVIATFSKKHPHYGTACRLWVSGSTFRYVAGSSLQNIQAYDADSPHDH